MYTALTDLGPSWMRAECWGGSWVLFTVSALQVGAGQLASVIHLLYWTERRGEGRYGIQVVISHLSCWEGGGGDVTECRG